MTKTSNKMSGITNNNNNNSNSNKSYNNNNINNNNNNKVNEKYLSATTTAKTKELSVTGVNSNNNNNNSSTTITTITTNNSSSNNQKTSSNSNNNNNNINNTISISSTKLNSADCDKITTTISSKLQAPQTRRSLPAPNTAQALAQRSVAQQLQSQQQLQTHPSAANAITKYKSGSKGLPSAAHQLQTIATVHHHHTAEPTPSSTIGQQQQQQQPPSSSSNSLKDQQKQQQQQQQQHLQQHHAQLHSHSHPHQQHPPHSHANSRNLSESVDTITTTPVTVNSHSNNNNILQQQRNAYNLQTLKAAANHLKAPAHSIPPRYQPPPQPANNAAGILKHINSTLRNGPAESGGVGGDTLNHQRTSAGVGSNKHPTTTNFDTTTTATHFNLKYPPDIPQLSPVYIPDSLKLPSSIGGGGGGVGGGGGRYLSATHQSTAPSQRQQAPSIRLGGGGVTNSQYFYNPSQQQQHQYRQQQQVEQQQQQQQQQDMLKFVRKSDQDHPSPNASITSSAAAVGTGTRLTAEQNRQLQGLINELRVLKEQNQRLLDDNQELRDLCCFLDDDRQKGRKLAREWQRFGRYTASVMRQEVAAYQHKLRQLDDKQQELITDNLELKELCLYLDEERSHIAANALCANCGASVRNPLRDDGDGSSSSTNAEETLTALRNYERQMPETALRTTLSDQTVQYVRSLERRIRQLEEERVGGATTPTANMLLSQHSQTQAQTSQTTQQQQQQQQQSLQQQQQQQQQQQHQTSQQQQQSTQNALIDPISSRPEAVVRALQVLEVREQLERDRLSGLIENSRDQMDDGEKALVREMCNVVWRKLESNVPSNVSSI